MRPPAPAPARRLARGQALVEYSIIAHALLLGGSALMVILFHGDDGLLAALDRFYDSAYFVLSTGAL
jgi:hypothetical protein